MVDLEDGSSCRGAPQLILGTGVDVVEIQRVKSAVDRFGGAFIRRIYTPSEAAACTGKRGWTWERLAVRFAAKEAVMKAIGTGWTRGVRWVDIEIVSGDGGRPHAKLHGQVKTIAEQQGIEVVHIALSHGREVAVATATAVGRR